MVAGADDTIYQSLCLADAWVGVSEAGSYNSITHILGKNIAPSHDHGVSTVRRDVLLAASVAHS
jgi:hypothetical protein